MWTVYECEYSCKLFEKILHNENVESEDRKYLNAKFLAILFYNVKAKQTFSNNEIHLFLRYRKSLSIKRHPRMLANSINFNLVNSQWTPVRC